MEIFQIQIGKCFGSKYGNIFDLNMEIFLIEIWKYF